MALLLPPPTFGMVEEGLSRSGLPSALNLPFLRTLQLKTVVLLSQEDGTELGDFFELEGIEVVSPCAPTRAGCLLRSSVSEQEVVTALKVILSRGKYPLHIMCRDGQHRTGVVVGCLRKLQNWNLTSIFEEYRRYAGSKTSLLNEQFIELFDVELVHVNDDKPVWL